jgi:hypothetical protein
MRLVGSDNRESFLWVESHNRRRETEYASCSGNSTPIHAMRLVSGGMTRHHASDAFPEQGIIDERIRFDATDVVPLRGRNRVRIAAACHRGFCLTLAGVQNPREIQAYFRERAYATGEHGRSATQFSSRRELHASPCLQPPESLPNDPVLRRHAPCMKRTSAGRSPCWAN